MANKKEASEATTSRITRAPKSAPKASRKRTRLPSDAVAEFVAPQAAAVPAPAEIPPPENAWSPVERIHLEEVAVEEIQIEEVRTIEPEAPGAVAACAPVDEQGESAPWLVLGQSELLRAAFARLNRGFMGRWIERGRPYGERLFGRFGGLLGRFGIRIALR